MTGHQAVLLIQFYLTVCVKLMSDVFFTLFLSLETEINCDCLRKYLQYLLFLGEWYIIVRVYV